MKNFKIVYQIFAQNCSIFGRAYAYDKVYREANPLACASALTMLRSRKSKKIVLMREKLNFFKKTSKNSRLVPYSRRPLWTIILYLQPAVDRQPGHRRGDL